MVLDYDFVNLLEICFPGSTSTLYNRVRSTLQFLQQHVDGIKLFLKPTHKGSYSREKINYSLLQDWGRGDFSPLLNKEDQKDQDVGMLNLKPRDFVAHQTNLRNITI